MTLSAPDRARVGDPVPIVLRLRNASEAAQEIHFTGREIAFDIVVRNDQKRVIWQRLADAVIPAILQIRALEPGQVVEMQDVWRPEAVGRYGIQGAVPLVEPGPLRTAWKALTAG